MRSLLIERKGAGISNRDICSGFPSGDHPGMLYLNMRVNHFNREEVMELLNYLAEYLEIDITPVKNLNKKLIGEIDAKS